MQNQVLQEFASKTSLLLPDTVKRRVILPALIGMAIGEFLQPKLGEDLNPLTVFNDMHLGNVGRAVSYINEDVMIDVECTIQTARMLFLVRTRIANGAPSDYSSNPEFDFLAVALGLSPIMNMETYSVIKESGLSACQVFNHAKLMIGKLLETKRIQL